MVKGLRMNRNIMNLGLNTPFLELYDKPGPIHPGFCKLYEEHVEMEVTVAILRFKR